MNVLDLWFVVHVFTCLNRCLDHCSRLFSLSLKREHQSLEGTTGSSLGVEGHEEEITRMSAALETLGSTARNLTAQHAAAERYVSDLRNERRATLRNQLTEVADAVKVKKAAVDTLRAQLTSQQKSIRV